MQHCTTTVSPRLRRGPQRAVPMMLVGISLAVTGAFGQTQGTTSQMSPASNNVTAGVARTLGRSSFGVDATKVTGLYAGRTDFFPEGYGYYRPYSLSPRPVYRTEIGAQPIRRNTFSLGYVSYGGYGSYYY